MFNHLDQESQKRKAYGGRPPADTVSKRPRYEETGSQRNFENNPMSSQHGQYKIPKKLNKVDTEFVTPPTKSGRVAVPPPPPSPYAHLPPSPPRLEKPNMARNMRSLSSTTTIHLQNSTPKNNCTYFPDRFENTGCTTTNSSNNIQQQSETSNTFDNVGYKKRTSDHQISGSLCGNSGGLPGNYNPKTENRNAYPKTKTMADSKPILNNNTGNFQLFPIDINAKPCPSSTNVGLENMKNILERFDDSNSSSNNNNVTRKRPSRFSDLTHGNEISSERSLNDLQHSRYKIGNIGGLANNRYINNTGNLQHSICKFAAEEVCTTISTRNISQFGNHKDFAFNKGNYRFFQNKGNFRPFEPDFSKPPPPPTLPYGNNDQVEKFPTQHGGYYNKNTFNNRVANGGDTNTLNKKNTGNFEQQHNQSNDNNNQFLFRNNFENNTNKLKNYPEHKGRFDKGKGHEQNTGNFQQQHNEPNDNNNQFLFRNNCENNTNKWKNYADPKGRFDKDMGTGPCPCPAEQNTAESPNNTKSCPANIGNDRGNENIQPPKSGSQPPQTLGCPAPPPTPYNNSKADYVQQNIQFGMKRRTSHFVQHKMNGRFGTNEFKQFGNNTKSTDRYSRPNHNTQQLPPISNYDEFQINPPLLSCSMGGGGNQHFYEDINPAPPVDDRHSGTLLVNQHQSVSSSNRIQFSTDPKSMGRGRGVNNLATKQMSRPFRNNQGSFGNHHRSFDMGNNSKFIRNTQTMRMRGGGANHRGSFKARPGLNKTQRWGLGRNSVTNQNFPRKPFIPRTTFKGRTLKQAISKNPKATKTIMNRKIENKFGKVIKKPKKSASKTCSIREKKPKTKKTKTNNTEGGGDKLDGKEHVDVNKELFGDFQPISVGLRKPAKGHLKPQPEEYWKQWWSLYGYVEKSLPTLDPNDEHIKSQLRFQLSPTDPEFRKRKRVLMVMGVAKILRHIHLNEKDYALRDIFNVLKYKHQLEDGQFQQHLTAKEMERIQMVLKNAQKKTRRALFYQSMICRWHFSTTILKRSENGESLKCGHARKLVADKVFNFLVWESIQELKKLILSDWPGFEEFYKTL